MRRLLGLFTLFTLAFISIAALPDVTPYRSTTYWEKHPFRQFGAAESMLIRNNYDNDIVEAWVSPSIGRTAIQRVLADSLGKAPSGGILKLMPGVYSFGTGSSGQPLEPQSNTTITGVSDGEDIAELSLNVAAGGSGSQSLILFDNGSQDNIVIENILFDGNLDVADPPGFTRIGIKFDNNASTHVTIRNCTFRNLSAGIEIEADAPIEDLVVEDCLFQAQVLDSSISMHGINMVQPTGTHPKRVTIRNCEFTGFSSVDADTSRDNYAIRISADNSLITGNYFHDYGRGDLTGATATAGLIDGFGIFVEAGTQDVLISNNLFKNVMGDNISIRGKGVEIVGNRIVGSRDQGIVVEDVYDSNCLISNNVIDSSYTAGIRVLNSTHVGIVGNYINTAQLRSTLTNPTYMALISIANLQDATVDSISDVLIDGNTLLSQYGNTRFGILIDSTETLDYLDGIHLGQNKIDIINASIDTLYGGEYFPDKVVSWNGDLPLYPFYVLKKFGTYNGIPGDDNTDRYAIQRWVTDLSETRLTGIPGTGSEFLMSYPCSLFNNVHIDGGRFYADDGIAWNAIPDYKGMFFCQKDTNVTLENMTICGNAASQDTTLSSTTYIKHLGIGVIEKNVDIHILNNHICDWTQDIWFGTAPNQGGGNQNIRIMGNDLSMQTYYSSQVPTTIGINAIHCAPTAAGDSAMGINFSYNTIVDEAQPKSSSTASTPSDLLITIYGNLYASQIQENYYRVPGTSSFTRGATTVTDSTYTRTTYERKAP